MAEPDGDWVQEMVEAVRYFLDIRGLPESDSDAVSDFMMEYIYAHHSGESLRVHRIPGYIKKAIRELYNGRNVSELATHFNVSRATVYRYCKK